ncbi:hypothetical protein MtrunA17_Chr2g0281131 [Medicago truncatula]|uniref:Uncharacterized protein n=1 Tax=Medicago truncatula TaxID=3880 RepID=A0A396J1E7_MEDTR|nr:hypothetical protein MtrunA17_Chr2g0281131 [Medicago truncatula]
MCKNVSLYRYYYWSKGLKEFIILSTPSRTSHRVVQLDISKTT